MKQNKYVIDFENENNEKNIIERKTHIWLYDFCEISTLSHTHGTSINQFMAELEKKAPCVCFSHNLKYDGIFIIDYLLKNNFKHIYSQDKKENLLPYEFSTLIASTGVFYSIKICFPYAKNKKKKIVEFYDSCKKIHGSVRDIAISYNLPILKGEIDYTLSRPVGYIPTETEIKYIENDTEIIARVLAQEFSFGLDKMTTASDTLALYKVSIGNLFKHLFPILDYDIDTYIRRSYRGGCVIVSKKYVSKLLAIPVHVFDANSMYPFQMCSKLLPYGEPKYYKGKYKNNMQYPLYIQQIEVCCSLKENKVPCILMNNMRFAKLDYLVTTENELYNLTLTSVDLQLLYDNYDIYDIKYIDGFMFFGSKNLFKKFILPLYEKKSSTKGSEKQLYKLLLNGLYGKFATNPKHQEKIPYINDKNTVSFFNSQVTIDKPIYTAVSSFITSYARDYLLRIINNNIDNFIYCDTDSIHCIGNLKNAEIDNKKLGAFKLEKTYVKSKYLAQKTYLGITENGEVDCKIAGCPKNLKEQINFNNFAFGNEFYGKLIPKKVDGGSILETTTFTLKSR